MSDSSDPLYVLNESSLQLSKLIEKSEKGLADLMPGEVGKIPANIINQPRIKSWIESGRLKVISLEEFNKHFNIEEKQENNIPYKAKYQIRKTEETTVIIPGVDELPEIDNIPEPDVENIDGTIAIRAPESNEPLTEFTGDAVTIQKEDLRPVKLNNDGTFSEMELQRNSTTTNDEVLKPKTVLFHDRQVTPQKSTEVIEKVTIVESVTDEVTKDVNEVTSQKSTEVTENVTDEVTTILQEKAWRRQLKSIQECTDPEVLLGVAEKVHRDVIKKACAERLEQLT